MEHLLPNPYTPNPRFYFVARRMKLPLSFKSKVRMDPACNTVPTDSKDLGLHSKPPDRGGGENGIYTKKHNLWREFTKKGRDARVTSVVTTVGFGILFVFLIYGFHMGLLSFKSASDTEDGSAHSRARGFVLQLVVALCILVAGFVCIQTNFGVFI